MTRCKLVVTAAASSLLLLGACNKAPEASQTEAVEAQGAANQKINEAKQEAVKDTAAVQAEADQKIAEAQKTAAAESAKAQANANDTIRAATEDIVKARNDLREWAQKKLDEVDHAIDAVQVDAQKASPKAKVRADYERAMADIQAKRTELHDEVASIDKQPATDLTKLKDAMTAQVDALKTHVEDARKLR